MKDETHSNMNRTCSNGSCGRSSDLKKCSLCSEVFYCSKECQEQHWTSGHKDTCFGKKYPVILQAIEISLFGEDNGGSSIERLVRIESRLEGMRLNNVSPNVASRDSSIAGIKARLVQVMTSCYISPIVEITIKDSIQYAVFSPSCYYGCYKSKETAKKVLNQAWIQLKQEKLPVCPKGFIPDIIQRREFPALNWTEHSMIAVYLSKYNKIRGHDEPILPPFEADMQMTLPRTSVPTGLYFVDDDTSDVFLIK